jgi:hypothetical protein
LARSGERPSVIDSEPGAQARHQGLHHLAVIACKFFSKNRAPLAKSSKTGIYFQSRLNDVLFETTKQPGQPKEAKIACAVIASGGGIAQLGERLHGMQEVSGSIPLTSTKSP